MTQTELIIDIIIAHPGLKLKEIAEKAKLSTTIVAPILTPLVSNMQVLRREHRYYYRGK